MALKALFSQFPSGDGDLAGKMLGYVLALEGEPLWAIRMAVKRFLAGEVSTHDAHWLPTSAEVARVVRELSEPVRKRQEGSTVPQIAWRDVPGPEESARIAAKLDACNAALERTARDNDLGEDSLGAAVRKQLQDIADKARARAYGDKTEIEKQRQAG